MRKRRFTTARRRPPCHRRGSSIVEGVLIMSMLLMVTFGSLEYGYAFYIKNAIQQSAYAGIRAAITQSSTNSTVQTAVTNSLTASGVNSSQYTITTSPATITGVTSGTQVTVTVSATWSNVGISPLPVSMGGLPSTKQLQCSVVMSHE